MRGTEACHTGAALRFHFHGITLAPSTAAGFQVISPQRALSASRDRSIDPVSTITQTRPVSVGPVTIVG